MRVGVDVSPLVQTRAGTARRGVYMTDGIFNVALLNFGDELRRRVPGQVSR